MASSVLSGKPTSPEEMSLAAREITAFSMTVAVLDGVPSKTDPMHRVIYTPELCEHVLAYLRCDDLTRVRRVSHYLKEIVGSSPLLQQNLYMTPRSVDTTSFLVDRFSTKLTTSNRTGDYIHRAEGESEPTLVSHELHPALEVHYDDVIATMDVPFRVPTHHSKARFVKREQSNQSPEHSLLSKMYICQPPVKKLVVKMSGTIGIPLHLTMDREDGVKFGHLVKTLRYWNLYFGMGDAYIEYLRFPDGILVTSNMKCQLGSLGRIHKRDNPYYSVD